MKMKIYRPTYRKKSDESLWENLTTRPGVSVAWCHGGLVSRWPGVSVAWCLCGLVSLWPGVSVAWCLGGLVSRWPGVFVAWCLGGLVSRWPGVSVAWCPRWPGVSVACCLGGLLSHGLGVCGGLLSLAAVSLAWCLGAWCLGGPGVGPGLCGLVFSVACVSVALVSRWPGVSVAWCLCGLVSRWPGVSVAWCLGGLVSRWPGVSGLVSLWPGVSVAWCLGGLVSRWPGVSVAWCLGGLVSRWPGVSVAWCLGGLVSLWPGVSVAWCLMACCLMAWCLGGLVSGGLVSRWPGVSVAWCLGGLVSRWPGVSTNMAQPKLWQAVLCAALLVVVVITVCVLVFRSVDEGCPPGTFRHAAVSADSRMCSDVGRDMLRRGGSAVDGAIAALLCTSVVNPQSSGLGGGGIFTIREKSGQVKVFSSRETVPKSFKADLLNDCPTNLTFITAVRKASLGPAVSAQHPASPRGNPPPGVPRLPPQPPPRWTSRPRILPLVSSISSQLLCNHNQSVLGTGDNPKVPQVGPNPGNPSRNKGLDARFGLDLIQDIRRQ
ncbi:hypothetical protein CRUP_013168, partial [Coryphaenoides rupestris]